jgi:uncharacterized protein (UPF0332 family)
LAQRPAGGGGNLTFQEKLFDKARRYLKSAKLLLASGDLDSAVSRIYYAAFYVAEALLDAQGLSFSSHRAVISAFGLHFAKTGKLAPDFHQLLIAAFEKRQMGDYLAETSFSETEVEDLLKRAEAFVDAGTTWQARK